MDITVDFLRDEVRSGFYIPTAIKQVWASQLLVLSEIDRICTKYNITYFADWGTLLGTVRHGGYIPWDDDLDICMKREDYIRFRQVADQELPDGFAIHDYERQEDHWLFLARVVNRNQICFEEEHLNRYFNFPYIASIDIFLLDYLYNDEAEERKRCDEVKYLIALGDSIVAGRLNGYALVQELSKIENKYCTKIDRSLDARGMGVALYRLAEQQMARVPEQEAERIGQIFPWILKGGRGLPKRCYEKAVRLPFECGTMPVPACYHQVTQHCYGNYFTVHKVWNGHDYPYFEAQKKNLQAVAEFKLPEFTYDPKMQRQADTELDKSGSLKSIANECGMELGHMTVSIVRAIGAMAYEDVVTMLPECQQLAVDFGTLVESVKGEESTCAKAVVSELESLCDALFSVYEELTGEAGIDSKRLLAKTESLQQACERVKQASATWIIEKKEILFVATGAKQWMGFDSLYRTIAAEQDNDVYVVPVPVLRKNIYGQVTMADAEILAATGEDDYPQDIRLTDWNSYSLELHHPDMIFIQDPYDGENPCLTIPPQFYAKHLQRYTEKLVYIPPFAVEEFTEADTSALYNMKHYVTAPGVACADYVVVQSEDMKRHYVNRLTEFSGEDTRGLWEQKILPLGLPVVDAKHMEESAEGKKHLLVCIGCNMVSEWNDCFLDILQEKLAILSQYREKLQIDICMYPQDVDAWKTVAGEEVTQSIIREIKSASLRFCYFKDKNMSEVVDAYDAYYGSPSPYAHAFQNEMKPVMLAQNV